MTPEDRDRLKKIRDMTRQMQQHLDENIGYFSSMNDEGLNRDVERVYRALHRIHHTTVRMRLQAGFVPRTQKDGAQS